MRFSSFCAVCALFVLSDVACASDASAETKSSEAIVVDVGPGIKEISPILGWNRCMGDTAESISQWKRWWTYLRMKEPVIMDWVDGVKIKIYPTNEVYRSIYVNGKYDPNVTVIVKTLLKSGDTFIDVGSNCGYVSLAVLKKLGKEGKIVAIEPSSRDYKRLVENVDINKLDSQIKTIQMAAGDRLGSKTMLIASEERSNSNTLANKFAFQGIEKAKTEQVNVTTIDNIVDTENLTRVDVIKLDVEGSEARCLEGAAETIKKFRPAIIIGINSEALSYNKRTVADIEKFLADNKYKMYDIKNKSFELVEVKHFEKMDSYVGVCLPEEMPAPTLPKAENIGCFDKVKRFFK